MLNKLDNLPILLLVVGSLTLGMAPFMPEPHLLQKIKMLIDGSLAKPVDIFDLVLHGLFPTLLSIRLIRMALNKPVSD